VRQYSIVPSASPSRRLVANHRRPAIQLIKCVAPSAADASSPAARRMMTFAGSTGGYSSDGGTTSPRRPMPRWIIHAATAERISMLAPAGSV
jgi:hypothetical protein